MSLDHAVQLGELADVDAAKTRVVRQEVALQPVRILALARATRGVASVSGFELNLRGSNVLLVVVTSLKQSAEQGHA